MYLTCSNVPALHVCIICMLLLAAAVFSSFLFLWFFLLLFLALFHSLRSHSFIGNMNVEFVFMYFMFYYGENLWFKANTNTLTLFIRSMLKLELKPKPKPNTIGFVNFISILKMIIRRWYRSFWKKIFHFDHKWLPLIHLLFNWANCVDLSKAKYQILLDYLCLHLEKSCNEWKTN